VPKVILSDPDAVLSEPLPPTAPRVLIVANDVASSPALADELERRTQRGPVRFHLVVPALNGRLRHWLSDSDGAVLAAHTRGAEARAAMANRGISVSVEIGDGVPLIAIADALARFDATEILISTRPANRVHWMEKNIINRAHVFGLPVDHVIAVEEAERAVPRSGRRAGALRVSTPSPT
jgi:hypothetical protein